VQISKTKPVRQTLLYDNTHWQRKCKHQSCWSRHEEM